MQRHFIVQDFEEILYSRHVRDMVKDRRNYIIANIYEKFFWAEALKYCKQWSSLGILSAKNFGKGHCVHTIQYQRGLCA